MKKILSLLLIVCLVFALCIPVFAEDYTYTVRFYSGRNGTFGGQEVVTYDNLKYGDVVSFSMSSVTLNNSSKYYVRGIRESGLDNDTISQAAFTVTEDRDYVVAYGILGDSVAYTVNYVDTAGNTLHASDTYYGNVGDRPVVSYRYIDGYQPMYYNITGTLSANAAENNWTFVYNQLVNPVAPTPQPTPTPTPTTAPTTAPTAAPTTPEEGGTGEAAAPGTETEPGAEAAPGTETEPGAEAAPGTQQNEEPATVDQTPNTPADTETGAPPAPEEILDMDTPLAEFEGSNAEGGSAAEGSDQAEGQNEPTQTRKVPMAAIGGGIAAIVILAIIIAILLGKRKKRMN